MGGGHWDPGPNFPWDRVIQMALGGEVAPPPKPKRRQQQMIANTASGNGYWIVKPDGAVYAFGDAQYKGAPNNPPIVPAGHEIVGIAGKGNDGYRIVASDGATFCYGSAGYAGRPDR
jgi:hypothetical protein